jgi:hypothetical protein
MTRDMTIYKTQEAPSLNLSLYQIQIQIQIQIRTKTTSRRQSDDPQH